MEGHHILHAIILISLLCSTCNSGGFDFRCDNSGNQTILQYTNPQTVFETYGYSDENIPRDLSHINAKLLHEESVLHVLDHNNKFKRFNLGSISKLYEGVLRFTGENVLIKRLNVGNFDALLNEAVVMSYLADNPNVPVVFGLLPAGPTYDDMTLVLQHIQNSSNLNELQEKSSLVSECDWIDISVQVASVLLSLHNKYVLFNDLHENNILIQWRGSSPYVYIVDYGQAAFRHGESYADTPEEERAESDFMGPEVWYDTTSPASDVYSLGDMLLVMSKFVQYPPFMNIVNKCHQEIVKDRISLRHATELLTVVFTERCPRTQTLKADDEAKNVREISQNFTSFIKNRKPMMSPLPIIMWEHLRTKEHLGQWVNTKRDVMYRHVFYLTVNSEVVIKEFVDEEFDGIRYEAVINSVMNDTGYVLDFYGLVSIEESLTNVGIVQQYVKDAESLWEVFHTIKNESNTFKILLAVELTKAVSAFHRRGILINNITPQNILLLSKEKSPKIKFIDLRMSTEHNVEPFWHSKNQYSCPSIREQNRVTYASDVFSLGIVLQKVFSFCSDTTITEMLYKEAHPILSNRPSAEELHEFFAKKLWTTVGA